MKYLKNRIYLLILIGLSAFGLKAQVHDQSWKHIVYSMNNSWYGTEEAQDIAEYVILHQKNIGGWHKNVQMQKPLSESEIKALQASKSESEGCTIDNGATYLEMVYLAKVYNKTHNETYKKAFLKGLDYILEAQYPNGGWPQFYPLKKGYYTHITYNDRAMVNVLTILKDLNEGSKQLGIKIDEKTLAKTKMAFAKGIDCILKTQYKQNGILTGWCAQHDETTLQPAKARAYELPSLSGQESADIVLLLMDIKHPSADVKRAVEAADAWFEKTKITGIEIERYTNEEGEKEKRVVKNPDAKPLWARFMELDDNTPFFCDRDGIKKSSLAEIGRERRAGYSWYNTEPNTVLKQFTTWKNKNQYTSQTLYDITVAQNGSGDYTTIQDAINNCKSFPYERITIHVKNGTYMEKVHVYEWNPRISIIGEDKDKTIIVYNDAFKSINLGRNSTFHTSTVLVEGHYTQLKNLTIKNSAGPVGQAIALSINASKCIVDNCNILGNQDTVYLTGENNKQWFKNCLITGTTDFIFGNATTLFTNCVLESKSDSYITAASTEKDTPYGFVFKNCTLTAQEGVTKVYLGRPWRKYAKTTFLECDLGRHITKEGWHNWNKNDAEKLSSYNEYNNTGLGSFAKNRVLWSHQLNDKQAKTYTIENILGIKSETSWLQ